MKSIDERYWAKVDKRGPDECWPWTAAANPNGYGVFRDEHGVLRSATRWAYGRFVGPIRQDQDLCHTCDNPPCHNPAHWWPGTRKENVADMDAKGRGRRGVLYGERNANAKLTDAQRADIRARRPATTLKVLADEYGVSIQCVWQVVHSPHHGQAYAL